MKRLLMILGVAAVCATSAPAHAQEFVVVVNAANPVQELTKDQLSAMLLKKVNSWGHGGSIVPVDLDKSAATREAFSRAVHGKSVSAIESFWLQQVFSGKDNPPQGLANDAAVVEFVSGNPNAIGYVTAGLSLGSGVKAVQVTGL